MTPTTNAPNNNVMTNWIGVCDFDAETAFAGGSARSESAFEAVDGVDGVEVAGSGLDSDNFELASLFVDESFCM